MLCTIAGAKADHRNRQSSSATWLEARKIPKDSFVEVCLASGDTLKGTLIGVTHRPHDSYSATYAQFRTTGDSSFYPVMDEKIVLLNRSGNHVNRVFRGFEPGAVSVIRSAITYPVPFALSDIAELRRADGSLCDLQSLNDLMVHRKLPMATELNISSGEKSIGIPLEQVLEIYKPPLHTHYWAQGMVAGMVLDAAAVFIFTRPNLISVTPFGPN